jgi:predicted transposase YdaD
MGVLRESPWYEEILKEGEARGKAEAEARGEVQGIILSIRTSLEAKFGNEGLKLIPQISQINDLEELKGILRSVVLANNLEELRQTFS